MAAVYTFVCQGACGKTFTSNRSRPRKFCSKTCYGIISDWTEAQIRFHVKRAGSIAAFCRHVGLSIGGYHKKGVVRDIDRLHSFQMVNIGGVLAKKCPGCEVTRELGEFTTNNATASGVDGHCRSCRLKK